MKNLLLKSFNIFYNIYVYINFNESTILLPNIFDYAFTYITDLDLKVGDYVLVPFGKSKMTGVVWDEFEKEKNINSTP